MSFEDDAYWESEYTDRSPAGSGVSRRRAAPVDELAARRERRQGRYRRRPRRDGGVQKGFDSERPSWLDDPDFVPPDVSSPDVTAGHGSPVLDFNRPELGAAFDAPSRQWTADSPPVADDDDWDDEIDEPYDHRVGTGRRSSAPVSPQPVPPQPAPPAGAPANLRAVRWRLDGGTLREVVDDPEALRELSSRLDGSLAEETDHIARARLLSLRAEVYRLLGELGIAAAASRLALAHAESARDLDAIAIAQAELAHVLRLGGHYREADRLLEETASSEAPETLRSVVHEYAGRSCFDQGRHMEALDHFARAIRLGPPDDLDLVGRIDVCLEAVYIHVLRDGWGPYPRSRREILGAAEP